MIFDKQQGDVRLFQTNDNGNISVDAGIVAMDGGLETAAYLSLFGGNHLDDLSQNTPFSWWGNIGETDTAFQYRSLFQWAKTQYPLTSGNLVRFEDAAKRDLQWFLDKQIASEVNVSATIPGLNTLALDVEILAYGQRNQFRFTENWEDIAAPFTVENGPIYSPTHEHVFTSYAGTQIPEYSTDQAKFAATSLKMFPQNVANHCGLKTPTADSSLRCNGDWNISFWIYFDTIFDPGLLFSIHDPALAWRYVIHDMNRDYRTSFSHSGPVKWNDTLDYEPIPSVIGKGWTYVEVSAVGNTLYRFWDGVLLDSGNIDRAADPIQDMELWIGRYYNGDGIGHSYWNHFKYDKKAGNVAPYSVPTAAPEINNSTALYMSGDGTPGATSIEWQSKLIS